MHLIRLNNSVNFKFIVYEERFAKVPVKENSSLCGDLCSLSAIFTSCGDDAEGRIEINNTAPDKVTEVNTAKGPGEVYLSWRIPQSTSFMYTKVEYMDAKGERQYQ